MPQPPSRLSAKVLSSSSTRLSWKDNSTNEKRFHIERRSGKSAYKRIKTVGANTVNFTDKGLQANTIYLYRVSAENELGTRFSNAATARTLNSKPASPSKLSAKVLSFSSIQLRWTDNSHNETRFHIERRLEKGAYKKVKTVSANRVKIDDSGLLVNTSYSYRVRAENIMGNSPYSNIATAKTVNKKPESPSKLALKLVSAASVELTWKDNSNNESHFRIDRRAGKDIFREIGRASGNVAKFTDKGLQANTTYIYRVRAENEVGNSSYSTGTITTKNSVFPIFLQGTRLPEEKTVTLTIRKPSNAVGNATLTMRVFDADTPHEGRLIINGKGSIVLFGKAAKRSNDRKVVSVSFKMPSNWWEAGFKFITFCS